MGSTGSNNAPFPQYPIPWHLAEPQQQTFLFVAPACLQGMNDCPSSRLPHFPVVGHHALRWHAHMLWLCSSAGFAHPAPLHRVGSARAHRSASTLTLSSLAASATDETRLKLITNLDLLT